MGVVISCNMQFGARVMWTTVPEDLKHIFNVTKIKTVDTWKPTIPGSKLDISMFIESVGVCGKHAEKPLVRGVPDMTQHPETITTSPTEEPVGSFGSRVAGGKHASAPKPVAAKRFTFSQMRK